MQPLLGTRKTRTQGCQSSYGPDWPYATSSCLRAEMSLQLSLGPSVRVPAKTWDDSLKLRTLVQWPRASSPEQLIQASCYFALLSLCLFVLVHLIFLPSMSFFYIILAWVSPHSLQKRGLILPSQSLQSLRR